MNSSSSTSASASASTNLDYMCHGYSGIAEPLNLCEPGQDWFNQVTRDYFLDGTTGLVLGATAWMAERLGRFCQRTIVVDHSPVMIEMVNGQIERLRDRRQICGEIEYIVSDWRDLQRQTQAIGTAVCDNAFSFLPYPQDWISLAERLADTMSAGGILAARMLSTPAGYVRPQCSEIIRHYRSRKQWTPTEVRANLLFAHVDDVNGAIDTESVLETFEQNRDQFKMLLDDFGFPSTNDLFSITKYRGARAVYFAPPLGRILSLFSRHFQILSVHFGPYALSQHFPLIIARKLP